MDICRRFLRNLAMLGLILAAVGAVPGNRSSAPDPERSEPVAYSHNASLPHMDTWNICNSASHCPDLGEDKGQRVWDRVTESPVPTAAVALQEICKSDSTGDHYETYDTLLAAFTWAGYKANWHVAQPNAANCDNLGVAVFWAGGCYNNACRIDQRFTLQDPGDSEERYNVCGRAAFPAYMACSTHLDDDHYYASRQASDEYTPLLAYMNASVPAFGMGDLNLEPFDTALDVLWFYWHESDGCRSTCWRNTFVSESTGNAKKLDYIWIPKSSHCIEHDVQIVNGATSDHHFLRGYPGEIPC